jgi:hypothetical protein
MCARESRDGRRSCIYAASIEDMKLLTFITPSTCHLLDLTILVKTIKVVLLGRGR